MDFRECVLECAETPEFVSNFNRLTGCNFGKSLLRKPIDIMIDQATGHPPEDEADIKKFVSFVFNTVWYPLVAENMSGQKLQTPPS